MHVHILALTKITETFELHLDLVIIELVIRGSLEISNHGINYINLQDKYGADTDNGDCN